MQNLVLLLALLPLAVWCDVYGSNKVVNGIPVAVREYWIRQAMQNQIDSQNTPCPTAFGALIVDHSPDRENASSNPNGTLMCTNSGFAFGFSATDHGEISALRACAQIFLDKYGSVQGRNFSLWNRLTLYTTGEPCPMCTAASHWQRLKEIVYSVSIDFIAASGRPQIEMASRRIHNAAGELQYDLETATSTGELLYPIDIIRDVLADEMEIYFGWNYDADAPCPAGCHRGPQLPTFPVPSCVKD